jgi:8-oxo-dGTP pyrophosphatase MutT (NUDIX family)
MSLLSDNIIKLAKSLELKRLIEAKKKSDNNDYAGKNKILADLFQKSPKQFKVDSELESGKYVGITHKPSGFQIHAPRMLVPVGIENKMKKAEFPKQERVRVIIPYKGQYLLERLSNPKWKDNFGKRRFIGGGIEGNETPQQAASRELKEELGVTVKPGRFKYVGVDPESGHHYLRLPKHDIAPGKYKASVGSDPFINLEPGLPHGEDYIGPNIKTLKKH